MEGNICYAVCQIITSCLFQSLATVLKKKIVKAVLMSLITIVTFSIMFHGKISVSVFLKTPLYFLNSINEHKPLSFKS